VPGAPVSSGRRRATGRTSPRSATISNSPVITHCRAPSSSRARRGGRCACSAPAGNPGSCRSWRG
jgi:hypothetical protein